VEGEGRTISLNITNKKMFSNSILYWKNKDIVL